MPEGRFAECRGVRRVHCRMSHLLSSSWSLSTRSAHVARISPVFQRGMSAPCVQGARRVIVPVQGRSVARRYIPAAGRRRWRPYPGSGDGQRARLTASWQRPASSRARASRLRNAKPSNQRRTHRHSRQPRRRLVPASRSLSRSAPSASSCSHSPSTSCVHAVTSFRSAAIEPGLEQGTRRRVAAIAAGFAIHAALLHLSVSSAHATSTRGTVKSAATISAPDSQFHQLLKNGGLGDARGLGEGLACGLGCTQFVSAASINRLSSRRKNSSSRLFPRSRKISGESGAIALPSLSRARTNPTLSGPRDGAGGRGPRGSCGRSCGNAQT